MAKKVLLAFDMDDTFTNTRREIIRGMFNKLTLHKLKTELDYVLENKDITPLLWTKVMCNSVFEHVVQYGEFMKTATPSPLMEMGLVDLLNKLLSHNWGPYLTSVVCTHRGFHEDGFGHTDEWLKHHNADGVIQDIHVLNPKDHPNKLNFLRKQYPEHEILLLDDNPFHDPHTVHPYSDEVLIYEGIHSLPGYVNQDKFTTLEDFKLRIIRKMFGQRGYESLLQQYADIA